MNTIQAKLCTLLYCICRLACCILLACQLECARKDCSLTFDVAVDDLQLLVKVVQSLKQLVGITESLVQREWTVLKHILL